MTQTDEMISLILPKHLQAIRTQHSQDDAEEKATRPLLIREFRIPEHKKCFLISKIDTRNQDLKSWGRKKAENNYSYE